MNCNCISETADALANRLTMPEATKPQKGATVISTRCAIDGICVTGEYILTIPFKALWVLPGGNSRTTEIPIRANFCPFCGKSVIKPQKLRKPKAPASQN